MDIFPLGQGGREADETSSEDKRAVLFKDVEEEGWCLFSIDVRNTYGLPFEVTLDRVQKSEETFSGVKSVFLWFFYFFTGAPPTSTSCIVAPGATTRYARAVYFLRVVGQLQLIPPQDGPAAEKDPAA